MVLDNRLKMIYDLLPNGCLCDIGTDHCRLCVYSILNNKASHAYATDINKGPLLAAKRLVEKYGLIDRIDLILSDGFKQIDGRVLNRVDNFVIAGMGGQLISKIMSDSKKKDATFVLQPMNANDILSEFICKNGYRIIKRALCKHAGKFYIAMVVKYDDIERPVQYWSGYKKDKILFEYLDFERLKLEKKIKGLKMGNAPNLYEIEKANTMLKLLYEEGKNYGYSKAGI